MVAYFSMEFAFNDEWKNYAGGLGVLAADIVFSAADLKFSMVGVSLIYHHDDVKPQISLKDTGKEVWVKIEDRDVVVRIYEYWVKDVPVYFLSSHDERNSRWDRDLTKSLYSSEWYTRLCQEYILGAGGVKALKVLGKEIEVYHMNEGHAAFLTLELLKEFGFRDEKVREKCTFTTHTPIKAGHDEFGYDLAMKTLGDFLPWHIKKLASEESLKMTELALSLSKKANSVSLKHNEVCREMFGERKFENVTNGVYHVRWAGEEMAQLFDEKLSGWREKPEILKEVSGKIGDEELVFAKQKQKLALINLVNKEVKGLGFRDFDDEDKFDLETLTIGFARRFVEYKRPNLIFSDLKRLRELGYKKIQLVFAANCHADDQFCNGVRNLIREMAYELRGQIRVIVLPYYGLEINKLMTGGCDVWLNNPVPPLEASGTSGMKAAINGGLNLSILDGWWIEGFERDKLSGWGISSGGRRNDDFEAKELYRVLEEVVENYYGDFGSWVKRMKAAIGLGAWFNTNRVVEEYRQWVWGV